MKRLLKVTGFSSLLTLLRMSTSLIVVKVIATYAGPSGLGMLGQLQSLINVFNGVVNSPVNTGVIRYTAENYDKGFEYCSPWWRASIQWLIFLLMIIIPIGVTISPILSKWLFHTKEYYWIIIIACCFLPFTAMNTLIMGVINGQQKYKKYISLGATTTILSTLITISFVTSLNIKGALIATSINTGVVGLLLLAISLRSPWLKIKYWWGKTDSIHKRKIGNYVLMAVTTAATVPVSLILIRNILVAQVGWDLTGQWQAVWKISEIYLSIITISLSTYYLPKLSKLTSTKDIRDEIKKTAIIIMPIVIFMAICIYLLRDIGIDLIFSNEFRYARNLFAIQLCGDVIKIFAWLYAYPMVSKGVTKWYVSSEIFFSLTFVILGYFLIGSYGVEGANLAYLANYTFYFIFVFFGFNLIMKNKTKN